MKMKVYAKGSVNGYDAIGLFDGKNLTVLKGSRISAKQSDKIQPVVYQLRNDRDIVSDDYVVCQDVVFKSPSTAAAFVTGFITNGMLRWRNEDGKKLKFLLEK